MMMRTNESNRHPIQAVKTDMDARDEEEEEKKRREEGKRDVGTHTHDAGERTIHLRFN